MHVELLRVEANYSEPDVGETTVFLTGYTVWSGETAMGSIYHQKGFGGRILEISSQLLERLIVDRIGLSELYSLQENVADPNDRTILRIEANLWPTDDFGPYTVAEAKVVGAYTTSDTFSFKQDADFAIRDLLLKSLVTALKGLSKNVVIGSRISVEELHPFAPSQM